MKRVLLFLLFLLVFLSSCGATYTPTCEKPEPGDWSRPERMVDYYDPVWGEGVLVLNTNLSGDYCYGYVTYVSPVSGPVKLIPVSKDIGKSILSGLGVDKERQIIFTGERTERKIYAVSYRDGKILYEYKLDRNPEQVKYLGDMEWKGEEKKRVVAVIGSKTPEEATGALYMWEEDSFLKGEEPFATLILSTGFPVDFVKVSSRIFVAPYSTGSLEEIDVDSGIRHLYSFPFMSLSWGSTYVDYCPSIDRICIATGVPESILVFDYHRGSWEGDIQLGFKPYNFQDYDGLLYVTSHDPGGVYVIGDGDMTRLLDVDGYSFVRVQGDYVFVSLFSENDFRIIER